MINQRLALGAAPPKPLRIAPLGPPPLIAPPGPLLPRGAASSNSTPPPLPLQTPPKFSNPSFSSLRFWGKGLALKALKIFFCPS